MSLPGGCYLSPLSIITLALRSDVCTISYIIKNNDVDLRSATKLHGVLVSCTEQNTKIRVPVQPGVYGIQHGAECVHDVVQMANYLQCNEAALQCW